MQVEFIHIEHIKITHVIEECREVQILPVAGKSETAGQFRIGITDNRHIIFSNQVRFGIGQFLEFHSSGFKSKVTGTER